jgi:hypothetical protein
MEVFQKLYVAFTTELETLCINSLERLCVCVCVCERERDCQYNCHEASVLGPTRIASIVYFASLKMRKILFTLMWRFCDFFHHIAHTDLVYLFVFSLSFPRVYLTRVYLCG